MQTAQKNDCFLTNLFVIFGIFESDQFRLRISCFPEDQKNGNTRYSLISEMGPGRPAHPLARSSKKKLIQKKSKIALWMAEIFTSENRRRRRFPAIFMRSFGNHVRAHILLSILLIFICSVRHRRQTQRDSACMRTRGDVKWFVLPFSRVQPFLFSGAGSEGNNDVEVGHCRGVLMAFVRRWRSIVQYHSGERSIADKTNHLLLY